MISFPRIGLDFQKMHDTNEKFWSVTSLQDMSPFYFTFYCFALRILTAIAFVLWRWYFWMWKMCFHQFHASCSQDVSSHFSRNIVKKCNKIYLLSHAGVNDKKGLRFDDWIYCTLYSHKSGLPAIQHYRWSTRFTVHSSTRTRVLSLY
jgi:hypothetical protein